jgi:hypothetical protein
MELHELAGTTVSRALYAALTKTTHHVVVLLVHVILGVQASPIHQSGRSDSQDRMDQETVLQRWVTEFLTLTTWAGMKVAMIE